MIKQRVRQGLGVVLLLLLFARLLFGAEQLSTTADEPSHLASGYSVLARGLDGLWTVSQRGHPLGVDVWLALPLWIGQSELPLGDMVGWQTNYATFFDSFWASLTTQAQALFSARVQVVLLTLLLAALVWRWGRDLWGPWAGLLALGVMAFDPTLIAHGRLATNDIGVTALGTWALYRVWRWTERPGWTQAWGIGILLALTMLAKASGVLWVAAAGAMMLLAVARRWSQGRGGQLLTQAAWAGLLSLFLLWVAYGCSWGTLGDSGLYLPAATHWEGILYHPQNTTGHRLAFALGQRTYGRWWWYFGLTFAIKNPLPLLIALFIGLGVLLRRDQHSDRWALALFPVFYTLVTVAIGENIGHRYLLPLYPFIYLAIGGGLVKLVQAGSSRTWPRWVRVSCGAVLGGLAIWYVTAGARVYPYEIAYFNELAGGPENGYRYLVDSNLSWGQADALEQKYVQAHPGVQDEPPANKYHPAPGRYLVSASYLQGVGIGDPYAYEWFRHREPNAMLGYSKLIYDVPASEIRWVALCSVPRVPLDPADLALEIGQEDLRVLTFDCTQGWLVPGESDTGIYVLHRDLFAEEGRVFPSLVPIDPFVAHSLAPARLSFDQPTGNEGQPFVLYEALQREPHGSPFLDEVPVLLRGPAGQEPPVLLDGPLAFVNAAVWREGNGLEVATVWRVTEGPISRPFSIMGHLVSAEGALIEGIDGLGISPLALVPGDLYVQRHRFSLGPSEGTQFQTGAYWLDTMAQWPILDPSSTQTLTLDLP